MSKRVLRDDAPGPEPSRDLITRIVDTPQLAAAVSRLQPEILHRVIQQYGLESCAELVALATPEQLTRVFDLDLWRGQGPGAEEQLDAERFGVWLEVLLESGADFAAATIARMDVDLVVAALARHIRVFDVVALLTAVEEEWVDVGLRDADLSCDIGGFRIGPRRSEVWDAIITVLAALDEQDRDTFRRLMAGCRALSNSRPEEDGCHALLTDADQTLFDLAVSREQRRERSGYVPPLQAQAFLAASRGIDLAHASAPGPDPIAAAALRGIEPADDVPPGEAPTESLNPSDGETVGADGAAGVAAIVDALLEAGVLQPPARGLLAASADEQRRLPIEVLMAHVAEHASHAFSARSGELAYLSNVLVAGCPLQSRTFTPEEASKAVLATCNLGLEHWPAHWARGTAVPPDLLVHQELVPLFQVGWTVLHRDVAMRAARGLLDALDGIHVSDREIQAGINALRRDLRQHCGRGEPWRAADAFDVLASLDIPAWAGLLGLIDQCPVLHAVIPALERGRVLRVDPGRFEFFATSGDVAAARRFVATIEQRLTS
jgi:hypothetical protein